jgi:hypothetical protein
LDPLIHCIYSSVATCRFDDRALAQLLAASRSKNARLGITGMLLHVDGCFFQVLEGLAANVDELFATIVADQRHARVTTIIREPIARRAFGDWTMGYASMDPAALQRMIGTNDFFGEASCIAEVRDGRARRLLEAFGRGRWRSALTGHDQAA